MEIVSLSVLPNFMDPARRNIKVPVGFEVGLGPYFTAPKVNTQEIK